MMSVPSLSYLAQKACIKNITSITDIGDAEFSLVKPVLLKLQNPKQLYQLEQNCPQIIGLDAEIWRNFCKRDISNYEKDPVEPATPGNWYKCYQKLYKAAQRDIDADAALLKATMDGIKNKQAQNTAQQVELRGVKVPSDLKKNIPTIALPKGSSVYRGMGVAREHSRDPIEKGPSKVVSTLAKIRRETASQSKFTMAKQLQRGIISTREMRTNLVPTKGTIVAAPRHLVEEHRKAKIVEPIDTSKQPDPVFNPRKRRIEHDETTKPDPSDRDAREKRLRALTKPPGSGSLLSSTIRPTPKDTTPSLSLPNADISHRQQLAKANSPQHSSPQSRPMANTPSPGKSGSPGARAHTPSPQIRPPMRINRAPANPLLAPKRRPVS